MLDLNPVYNYYSSVYAPKTQQTKYDSHKTSELKTVYNNMVKVNTNSPLFSVKVNESMQNYAIGLKSAAISLRNVSAFLVDDEEQAFSKLMTQSSDPQTITGNIITDDYDKLPEQLEFKVQSLAKGQLNEGEFLGSADLDVIPGAYSFSMHSADTHHIFNFNVQPNDTNLQVQQKLASTINNANIGLDAFTQQSGNLTRIIIESQDTGTDDVDGEGMLFSFQDSGGRMTGIVDTFGMNNVLQYPSDANFTINDMPQTSSSNDIVINKMVEVELLKESDEPVQLSFVPDTSDVIEKIKEFAGSYNQIIDIADTNSATQRGAKKLMHEVQGIANRHQSSLESVGLNLNAEGRMVTDDALLSQSVRNGEIQKMFQDLSGFREAITSKTEDISLDPMNYVDKTVITYPHPGHEFNNPYMPSMYSGMLYNYYV